MKLFELEYYNEKYDRKYKIRIEENTSLLAKVELITRLKGIDGIEYSVDDIDLLRTYEDKISLNKKYKTKNMRLL